MRSKFAAVLAPTEPANLQVRFWPSAPPAAQGVGCLGCAAHEQGCSSAARNGRKEWLFSKT